MSLDTKVSKRLSICSLKGYTLIEVLIATAIFGAMVTLVPWHSTRFWRGLMERGLSFWDYARYI
jgi:prepilin-type N-terminal cleavage/methylation domain-containing protein